MIYLFGQVSLDTGGLELKAGPDAITLQQKAFHLLQILIENRARLVSMDDIVDTV